MSDLKIEYAEALLKQVDADYASLFSPALRARQTILWGHIHFSRAVTASNAMQPSAAFHVKALAAYERARALYPPSRRQVR